MGSSFLGRRIEGEWPYLWLDATYLKVRDGGRVVSIAATIATAVNQDGRREIIGLGLGPPEAAIFWLGFLRDLHKRGLTGVKLVISDAHEGLKAASAQVFKAPWQRCRVGLLKKPDQPLPMSKLAPFCRTKLNGRTSGRSPMVSATRALKAQRNAAILAASRFRLIAAAVR